MLRSTEFQQNKRTIFIDCRATLNVDKLQANLLMNYLGFQTHAINSVLRLGVLNQEHIVVLLQEVGRGKEMEKNCADRK